MAPETVVNVIGTAAGLCSMASFTPQLIKIAREKQAEGVSLRTYVVNVVGFVLWIAYGVLLGSWPVAISNAVNLLLAAAILALRWRYGSESTAPSRRALES
ncbi:MAG TPA: SemiSWEET transporter [Caulobacteraceae bacterium]|jgi:MtN3 and saliva related transmembrane protein